MICTGKCAFVVVWISFNVKIVNEFRVFSVVSLKVIVRILVYIVTHRINVVKVDLTFYCIFAMNSWSTLHERQWSAVQNQDQ